MNETLFLDICIENYLALMKMLERTINLCPDDLWIDSSLQPQFWQEVFHILYYLDFYFGTNWKKQPERFDVKENLGETPTIALSKEELLNYLEEMREKCTDVLSNLTNEQIQGKNSYFWTGPTLSHKLVYNIRHSQHHIGKINSILKAKGIEAAKWVIDPSKK